MKIIGMDLGTTNTYLFVARSEDGVGAETRYKTPEAVVVEGVSDSAGSIATAVLYENGAPILVGNVAESEFYSNLAAQPIRRLASQFKPEIARGDPEILSEMTDFLRLLREALPKTLLEGGVQVIAGMPSLAREDFRLYLGQCFANAGWPKPDFVRESDAALVSCVQSGTLDPEEVERKCLILDFGGGTCDYTSVESMDVLQNGGDLLYGGRLFDDLFFQVFCRRNKDFAREAPHSPYEWYLHWVECRLQKEYFSNFLAARAKSEGSESHEPKGCALHVTWYAKDGIRRDAFISDYDYDAFLLDAENYKASPQMLGILSSYSQRGGLSQEAMDLLAGREVGLISWLSSMLEHVENRKSVVKVVLTGGSSRWSFVPEIVKRLFPGAACAPSGRSYEDIAYGLALFPILSEAQIKVRKLLEGQLEDFSTGAAAAVNKLMENESAGIIRECSERIVLWDIMPGLEAAQKKKMTALELEEIFSENIRNDKGLREIAEQRSKLLKERIRTELDYSFRRWLARNGVLLIPKISLPSAAISQEFFDSVNVKISRLDSINIMNFTLTKILPILAGMAAATVIAHSGEPVSTVAGGAFMGSATWLAAKAAPGFMARRKLPSFLLTDSNRRKIVEKNKAHIEAVLTKSFADLQEQMARRVEPILKDALSGMLARLTALNQVERSQ